MCRRDERVRPHTPALEKPGYAFFQHEHPIFDPGRLGFFFQQLQRFVHGFVGESKGSVVHGHHPARVQIEKCPRGVGRAGVNVAEGGRMVGADRQATPVPAPAAVRSRESRKSRRYRRRDTANACGRAARSHRIRGASLRSPVRPNAARARA